MPKQEQHTVQGFGTFIIYIMTNRKGILALSPLLVFLTVYLVTSIVAGDFYKIPISVAFMISSIYAISISARKFGLKKSIEIFNNGASKQNIMLMLWIFILAGAFANGARSIGSVDATVNLMLSILPQNMVLPGLFLATCFISLSIGTSVGTIVALVPIAAGLAQTTGSNITLMTAVVVGGAFFGDNLSFISDTTIAATSSQGCSMKDKFRVNFFITSPAAILALLVYTCLGMDLKPITSSNSIEFAKVIPYFAVLATAIAGMNVMIVLSIGILLTGVIGIASGCLGLFDWFHSMGDGIMSMGELIIVTMLAGGMFEIVKSKGGIDYIIEKISSHIHGRRGAEAVVGMLVASIDVCTANNTVAIISVGGIARKISEKFGIDKRKTASLLDTCSCCMQGIIPYGAQMLMASGLAKINPISIIPYLYYPFALIVCVIMAITMRLPRRYS